MGRILIPFSEGLPFTFRTGGTERDDPAAIIYSILVDTRAAPPVDPPPSGGSATFDRWLNDGQKLYNLSYMPFGVDSSDFAYSWEITDVSSTDSSQIYYKPRFIDRYTYIKKPHAQNTTLTIKNPRSDTTITYTLELTVFNSAGSNTETFPVSISCTDSATGAGYQCISESD